MSREINEQGKEKEATIGRLTVAYLKRDSNRARKRAFVQTIGRSVKEVKNMHFYEKKK